MKTQVTTVTERGQISIPAHIRKQMQVNPGQQLVWEPVSSNECRVFLKSRQRAKGAAAMRGYAKRFRPVRPTAEWMAEIRKGEI